MRSVHSHGRGAIGYAADKVLKINVSGVPPLPRGSLDQCGPETRENAKGIAPCPIRRAHSTRRTANRRAHDFLASTGLQVPRCHEKKLPHRACAKCGELKGVLKTGSRRVGVLPPGMRNGNDARV